MAKDKKKPVKTPKKVSKKTKKETKPKEPTKPKMTLKEKVNRTVDDHIKNHKELKKQVFGLIQRTLYPDQFCPKCNDRLFFNGQVYDCPNCGYQRQVGTAAPNVGSAAAPVVRPSAGGKTPEQVEKAIQHTEEGMKTPAGRRRGVPTKRGAQIQKLVNERDSGGPTAPTPQDESAVRRDKNVAHKINWV